MLGEGGEVVTRQPYRKVWLDHLLSKELIHMHSQETVYAHFEKGLSSPCYLVLKDSFSHSKKH